MKEMLATDKERYPYGLHQMDRIIKMFIEKQASYESLFYAHYGYLAFQKVVFKRLGLADINSMETIRVVRRGYAPVVSGGAEAGSFIFSTVSKILALEGQAMELFTIQKPGLLAYFGKKYIRLNSDAVMILERRSRPMIVFLVIAAKRIKASSMLNEFISCVIPSIPSDIITFNDSKLTQIFYFDYEGKRACIIYLKIEEGKETIEYKAVETIAVSLIQKASFTCLFVDSPEEYAKDIITKAFPYARIPRHEEDKQQFNTHLAAIYPENRENMNFWVDLERGGMQHARIRVRNFSAESLKRTILDVKEEFDISTTIEIESEALLEALRNAEMAIN